jgi:DNA-binding NtrC family response regulator
VNFPLAAERPQRKILVVEDEAIVALDLRRLLREAGYRVVGPAGSMADIQRLIRWGGIDCAIVDADVDRLAPLPIADVLAWVDVPFVFLTTGSRTMVPAQHRHRPVVEKPFGRDALLKAVEQAMAGHRRAVGDDLRRRTPVVSWPRIYPPL